METPISENPENVKEILLPHLPQEVPPLSVPPVFEDVLLSNLSPEVEVSPRNPSAEVEEVLYTSVPPLIEDVLLSNLSPEVEVPPPNPPPSEVKEVLHPSIPPVVDGVLAPNLSPEVEVPPPNPPPSEVKEVIPPVVDGVLAPNLSPEVEVPPPNPPPSEVKEVIPPVVDGVLAPNLSPEVEVPPPNPPPSEVKEVLHPSIPPVVDGVLAPNLSPEAEEVLSPSVSAEVKKVPPLSASSAVKESLPPTVPSEVKEVPPPGSVEVEDPKQSPVGDSTNSSISDVSSGYLSTSVSTATLSECAVLNVDPPFIDSTEAKIDSTSKKTEPKTEFVLTSSTSPENQSKLEPADLELGKHTPTESQTSEEHSQVSLDASPQKLLSVSDSLPQETSEANVSSSRSAGPVLSTPLAPPTASKPFDPSVPVKTAKPSTPAQLSRPEQNVKPTPAPTSNPFQIHKVKTSGLKSFKGILHEEDEEGKTKLSNALSSLSESQERLEILSDSEESIETPDWLKEGEYVSVGTNKTGTVRYVGPTDFAKGVWVGVELDVPAGW